MTYTNVLRIDCRCGCFGSDAMHEATERVRAWFRDFVVLGLEPVQEGKRTSNTNYFGASKKKAKAVGA